MDVKDRIHDKTGTLVGGQIHDSAGLRWRLTLERRWERKLDEVIALTGACQGVSVAGDDRPGDGASLPSFELYCRTAAAYEDLGAIGAALNRTEAGTFGMCGRCKRLLADEWLARDPLRQFCAPCALREPVGSH